MQGNIDYAGVRNAASDIKNYANNMKSCLDATSKHMTEVNTTDVWQSDAAQELSTQFKALASKFDAFHETILNFSKFLTETANTYENADKNISTKIG